MAKIDFTRERTYGKSFDGILKLQGHVASEANLPLSAESGDIYLVGEDNALYIFNGEWKSITDGSSVISDDVDRIISLTQSEYDGLSEKDPKSLSIMTDTGKMALGSLMISGADGVGVQSVVQTTASQEDGGTNVWTITLTNGQTSTLQVKNGNQGNSGYSGAAGELEVVNNLTDGGATAALSAEMGKTLNTDVSQLRSEINGIDAGDTSSYQLLSGFISTTGAVSQNANWRHTSAIPVPKGATITVVTAGTSVCAIAQDNNGTYTPLVPSKTSGNAETLNTYSYVAQNDIYVSVSLKVSVSGYSISVDGKLDLLTDKTEKLENDLNGELLKLNTTRRNYSTGLYYASTGELVAYSTWFVSNDYVPVSNGDIIVWNPGAAIGAASLVLYDAQKNRINYFAANAESRKINLDIDNVAYMRASFALSNIDNTKLIVNNETVWVPKDGNNEGVEGDVDLQKELLLPDMGFAMVRPGTCGGLTSYTAVTTEIMPVKGGEYVTIITNRPNREGCVYKFGLSGTTDINDIGKIGTASAVITGTVTPNHSDIDIDMPNGKGQFKLPDATVGAMFVIGEYNTNNERQPLSLDDFAGYYIAIGHYADPDLAIRCDVEQSFDNNQKYIAQSNIGLIDVLRDEDMGFEDKGFRIRNGAQANAGNAWVVTLYGLSTLAIPVTPGHIYRLIINKEPQSGFHFYWRLGVYTTSTPTNLYSDIVRDEYNSWNVYHTDSDIFDIRENEYGVSIQLTELTAPGAEQAAGTCVALRASDFAPGDIVLLDVTESQLYHVDTVVDRNNDKIPALVNACLRGKTSANSKNIQLLMCADHHGWSIAHKNAIRATNGFETIDAYVNVGDIMPSYYLSSQITKFQREFGALTKPGYIVVGNHDVGNCYYAGYACDHQQAYNAYIKPMVDNGWLSSGEYEANKPYWFHDNATYKVRFIGLYEYDDNLDFNETYWKAIEYDSSLPKLTFNTAYQTGAKVNAGDHTSHSFEAVQDVTTPANYYTTPSKLPSYIVQRGTRVIRQTQAQWFLDTLASTPASYGVIVIMHNPFSDNAVSMEKKFSWPANVNGSAYSQNSMTTDFVRNAIAAFMAGSNYSEKVVMKGNAAYLNTLNDGTIDYAYEVSKNFAQKNTGVYLLGLLGGHSHRDIIWKDPSQNIYQVAPNCAIVDGSNDKNGDVRRTNTDGIAADSLTVVSFSNGRIALVKIGVNVTENGTDRDYEVISY